MWKQICRVLRIGSLIAWGLLTLELCARVEDTIRYNAPLFGPFTVASLYRYDAAGRHGKANAGFMKWRLNEAGYRGPSLRSHKYRIVCLGSSETFGVYESAGNEWPRQLERELNSRAGYEKFEVVNAAYPGMTVANILRRLDETRNKLHPRMAILYPSYARYIYLDQVDKEKLAPPPENIFELRLNSRVEPLLKETVPLSVQDMARRYLIRRATATTPTLPRIPQASVDRFSNDLTLLIGRLRDYGIVPVVVTQSTWFGPQISTKDRWLLTAWRRFYPLLEEDGFLDMQQRMNQAASRVASANAVLLIRADDEMSSGSQYFADFVHFNDAGAQALAKLIANHLQSAASFGNTQMAAVK